MLINEYINLPFLLSYSFPFQEPLPLAVLYSLWARHLIILHISNSRELRSQNLMVGSHMSQHMLQHVYVTEHKILSYFKNTRHYRLLCAVFNRLSLNADFSSSRFGRSDASAKSTHITHVNLGNKANYGCPRKRVK